MIKVFYWAPFISKIATPLAVINSAIAIKKFSKGAMEPFIINLFNEWEDYSQNLKDNKLLLINLFKIKLNFIFSDKGFLMSRIAFLCIFILSFFSSSTNSLSFEVLVSSVDIVAAIKSSL